MAISQLKSGTVGGYDLGSGAVWANQVGSGAVLSGNIGSGVVASGHLASGLIDKITGGAQFSGQYQNYLANGGMWFAQRYNPLANSAITSGRSGTDTYSADRFKVGCISGGDMSVLYQRWDQYTSGFVSGLKAQFYGIWTMRGSGKFFIAQPIETQNSKPLDNRSITFQFTAKVSGSVSGQFFRYGILQTNSGVAKDTIPNSIVSGWSLSSGTDPTWGSGLALVSSGLTAQIPGVWTVYSQTLTAQSGHVCLIPIIWANNQLASGVQVHISEVGLYDG